MTSQGTPLPVASAPVSRPSNATPLSAQVPAPEEGTGLFGGAEEVISPQSPRRNSRVVLAPRPSSGIQPSQTSVEKQDVDSANNSEQDLVNNDANQNLAASQPLSSNLPANAPSLGRQKTGTSRRPTAHEWTTQPTSQEKVSGAITRLISQLLTMSYFSPITHPWQAAFSRQLTTQSQKEINTR